MTDSTKRRPAFLRAALFLLVAVSLTACAPDAPSPHVPPPGGGSSEAPDAEPAAKEPEEAPDQGPIEEAPVSSTECLVGHWQTDNDTVEALLQPVATGAGISFEVTGGAVFLSFDDAGEITLTYTAWTFEMVGEEGMVITVERDGVDSGTYEATDDGDLTYVETAMGSKVTMTTPQGAYTNVSEPMELPVQGSFVCEGDELEITTADGSSTLHRV